jgi:hypothetical protein
MSMSYKKQCHYNKQLTNKKQCSKKHLIYIANLNVKSITKFTQNGLQFGDNKRSHLLLYKQACARPTQNHLITLLTAKISISPLTGSSNAVDTPIFYYPNCTLITKHNEK